MRWLNVSNVSFPSSQRPFGRAPEDFVDQGSVTSAGRSVEKNNSKTIQFDKKTLENYRYVCLGS